MMQASLPMYDWPEARPETLAFWQAVRDGARARGAVLPEGLTDPGNAVFDHWRDPGTVFSQTCWGPVSLGLLPDLVVLAQPDYTGLPGGRSVFYRSAVVARTGQGVAVPAGPGAAISAALFMGCKFAFNALDSLSGFLSVQQDLRTDPRALATTSLETGSHRASVIAVAEGRADIAAIDGRSWDLALRFEPCARELVVVGWTAERLGLPFVTHRATDPETAQALRETLLDLGCHSTPKTQ